MSVEIQDRDQHGMGSLQCAIGSTLFLAVNQISSLPETTGQLTALHMLDLEENQLSSLPETIDHLTSLQYLCMKRNQLGSCPQTRPGCSVSMWW